MILTALNLNKVCRVCLMECDSMFSIYSELFEDNSDEKIPCIYEILINISSIKVFTFISPLSGRSDFFNYLKTYIYCEC